MSEHKADLMWRLVEENAKLREQVERLNYLVDGFLRELPNRIEHSLTIQMLPRNKPRRITHKKETP